MNAEDILTVPLTYPLSMEHDREVVLVGQPVPVTQTLYEAGVGRHHQLIVVEQSRGQRQDGGVGTVVLYQLGHLGEHQGYYIHERMLLLDSGVILEEENSYLS